MDRIQSQYRQLTPQSPTPFRQTSPVSPPAVRLDRIVAIPESESKQSGLLAKR
jgi:hypothetical protein